MASIIPIQNVYYLLTYAWNRWEEGKAVDVASVPSNELVDLLAHVLIGGTRRVVRRGLDRGYLVHEEERSALRGKIDFAVTTKRMLLERARAYCHFDELSTDVLHNRILRTTIGRLARSRVVDAGLRHELDILHRQLDPIAEIALSARLFGQVQIHRNNAAYDLLMRVCELIHHTLLAHEDAGDRRFHDFLRDDALMAVIFEEFVRNFYRRHLREYRVKDVWLDWDGLALDDVSRNALPRMHTDITLMSPSRVLIIDTKYYAEMLLSRFEVEKARPAHLYQLFAYLKNGERHGGAWLNSDGMLLYPTVRAEVDLRYDIQGHRVRLCTVNLDQPWQGIHRRLMEVVGAAVTECPQL